MEELQNILPRLAMFDTHRISQRCSSLINDQLFKAILVAFESHNHDLSNFKELSSTQATDDKADLKRKADELARIALK